MYPSPNICILTSVPTGQNFVPPDAVSPALRQPSPSSPWYQHVHWSGGGGKGGGNGDSDGGSAGGDGDGGGGEGDGGGGD